MIKTSEHLGTRYKIVNVIDLCPIYARKFAIGTVDFLKSNSFRFSRKIVSSDLRQKLNSIYV